MDMGQTMQQAMTTATGRMYKQFISQSTILAYLDVFGAVAIFALCFVPVTFFFSPVKASGGGEGIEMRKTLDSLAAVDARQRVFSRSELHAARRESP